MGYTDQQEWAPAGWCIPFPVCPALQKNQKHTVKLAFSMACIACRTVSVLDRPIYDLCPCSGTGGKSVV